MQPIQVTKEILKLWNKMFYYQWLSNFDLFIFMKVLLKSAESFFLSPQNYPWTTNLQVSLQTVQKRQAIIQTLHWSYQMMGNWQPNKPCLLKNEVKNHICSKCTVKMLIFKNYCKMLYRNKFLMKWPRNWYVFP